MPSTGSLLYQNTSQILMLVSPTLQDVSPLIIKFVLSHSPPEMIKAVQYTNE